MSDQPPNPRAEHRRSLLLRPRESFAVELKSWFDPHDALGTAKIIKATFALRNQNGGYLVVGIDDKTLTPVPPFDGKLVREWFHQDRIQQLVSKYASQGFEVLVDFENLDGHDYPVIAVPAGIVIPVACRADLKLGEQFLLKESDVYVRTLEKNGSISSGKLPWRDMPDLFNRCFDNREADHARFFSKLMPGLTAIVSPSTTPPTTPSVEDTQKKILEQGALRFSAVAKERKVDVERFAFFDVALQLVPEPSGWAANQNFLQTLRNANPDLTGWPVWLDSSTFHDRDTHPYVFDNAWEAFIYAPRREGSFGHWGHLDFWILNPRGKFFLRRVLQDDLGSSHATTAGKTVDHVIALLRTAEAIAVGQQISQALKCDDETQLIFTFRWSGLRGRQLEAWSTPMRWFQTGGAAKQDSAESTIVLPVGETREGIIARTYEAILALTRVFDGYELKEPIVREFVEKLLDRKL